MPRGHYLGISLLLNKFKLNNLIILIDYNKVQALTSINDGLPLGSLVQKFKSFDIDTINIKDGHSFEEMRKKSILNLLSQKQLFLILLNVKALSLLKMIQYGMQKKLEN